MENWKALLLTLLLIGCWLLTAYIDTPKGGEFFVETMDSAISVQRGIPY